MEKLVKESEYFIAWLLFWLCSTVGGFILGSVIGGIAGGILGVLGVDMNTIQRVGFVLGLIISIPLSYGMFRLFAGMMIVKKAQARASAGTERLPDRAFSATA
jgi:hypothetical protein